MDEVEKFINELEVEWQKQKCQKLLDVQNQANKEIVSAIKWSNPFFSYNGKALLKWYCANGWINVYFFKGKELNDKSGLFIETKNTKMRTLKIFAETEINEEGYLDLIKQAVVLNE